MKYVRTRTALAIVGIGTLAYILGCASAPRHDPLYDGEYTVTQSDSVAIYIDNTRSRDMTDPVFYLIGNGRHSLGRVPDLSKRKVMVDSRWLTGADGTFQVVVLDLSRTFALSGPSPSPCITAVAAHAVSVAVDVIGMPVLAVGDSRLRLPSSALGVPVTNVIGLRSDEQMGGVYAGRVVALVADHKADGDRPVMQLPRIAMRLPGLPAITPHRAVSSSPATALPLPTLVIAALVHPRPKFLFSGRHGKSPKPTPPSVVQAAIAHAGSPGTKATIDGTRPFHDRQYTESGASFQ